MIKEFLNLLKNSFIFSPFIVMIFLLIVIISFLVFTLFTLYLFFDSTYRLNKKQYPKNFLLDIILPIIIIISPIITITSLKETEYTSMEKFGYMLIIHIFLITPLIYFWSKNRDWENIETLNPKTWKQPLIILKISIAVIYPLVWGIYFNLIKYLRLNTTLDLSFLLSPKILEIIVIIIFMWPFFSIWVRLLLWNFLDLKNILWYDLKKIILTIHIYFLSYTIYFKIMEQVWKLSFIYISYVNKDNLVYSDKNNKLQNLIKKIYKNPIFVYLFLLLIILIEFLYQHGNLFFCLYLLLFVAIMKPLLYFLANFNGVGNNWIESCCLSDFKYLRWTKTTPRYPTFFWFYFNEIREQNPIKFILTIEQEKILQENIPQIKKIYKKNKERNITKISRYFSYVKNPPLKNRLKLGYTNWTHLRWVHTQTITSASKWHTLTGLFARNIFDKLALINNHWSHFHVIEKLESKKKVITKFGDLNIYKEFHFENPINLTQNIKISKIIEHNLLTNFSELKKKFRCHIKNFNNQSINIMDTYSQPEPDIIIDNTNATTIDKRIHGMDQKATQSTSEPTSKIYSAMSPELFERTLDIFYQELHFNEKLEIQHLLKIQKTLRKLADTCEDLKAHQSVWVENLHLFPKNFIPPLRIPNNVSTSDFSPESNFLFQKSQMRMHALSNLLQKNKVGENDYNKALKFLRVPKFKNYLLNNQNL